MWKESGAEKLPRDLAIVHFDTYINSPAAARKMLKASGGDTEAYLDLRAQRYMRLAARSPEKYGKYAKGWMNRVERLRSLVAQSDETPSGDAASSYGIQTHSLFPRFFPHPLLKGRVVDIPCLSTPSLLP